MVGGELKNINKVVNAYIFEEVENNSLEAEADNKYDNFLSFRTF